jgi:type IV pilus assembly protein PilC
MLAAQRGQPACVTIGEESGSLDAMLGKVADFYEEEVDEAVASLSSLMEPTIMVILGVLIGGLVVAMYLPIFKLGSVVQAPPGASAARRPGGLLL